EHGECLGWWRSRSRKRVLECGLGSRRTSSAVRYSPGIEPSLHRDGAPKRRPVQTITGANDEVRVRRDRSKCDSDARREAKPILLFNHGLALELGECWRYNNAGVSWNFETRKSATLRDRAVVR